jgi:signal transduction histidine kinase/CheY-like chemotaxis protein
MNLPLFSLEVRTEPDVVLSRQRARQIAGLLGFSPLDQTRIATAMSEIVRNAYQYAGGGRVEFLLDRGSPQGLVVRVRQRGAGIRDLQSILDGQYESPTGLGLGIVGARKLMDQFVVESSSGGATVTMMKSLPKLMKPLTFHDLARITNELIQQSPQGLLEELQTLNQELLRTLQELRERQAELAQLHNREIAETNRGVVALYSELDDNAMALRRISDLKTRFLSNMSHEFRSPLNTILSMSSFLLDGSSGELTLEQKKEIGFIRKAAEGLALLVNDLLDLAKVEAGKAVVRPTLIDVAELFDGLRGTTLPLLVLSRVSFAAEIAPGVTSIVSDEAKLTQILRNFLSNAVKFTEVGEIQLAARPGTGDSVIFSVSDTGIGITRDDESRIFEEFGQIETPLQGRVKGTGLGLPLSRKLAELLGGEISLQSELGVGSTFAVQIPRNYSPPAEDVEQKESVSRVEPPQSSVLVVEDDPAYLRLYEDFLAESGFQVISASTLEDARIVLRQLRPVAVLLDIILEAESGWTLLSELKGDPSTKTIPVFVLTMVDGRERAAALEADEFCVKPIEKTWLLERLHALSKKSSIERILIIDERESDRHLFRRLLCDHGTFVIFEASEGGQGIILAQEERPDVIVLDLIMPDMTGFEVLERLKSDDATKDIPIIINTAKTLTDDERRRLIPRAAAVLDKSTDSTAEALSSILAALRRVGPNPVLNDPEVRDGCPISGNRAHRRRRSGQTALDREDLAPGRLRHRRGVHRVGRPPHGGLQARSHCPRCQASRPERIRGLPAHQGRPRDSHDPGAPHLDHVRRPGRPGPGSRRGCRRLPHGCP